jgi:hypothetical protein
LIKTAGPDSAPLNLQEKEMTNFLALFEKMKHICALQAQRENDLAKEEEAPLISWPSPIIAAATATTTPASHLCSS